MHRLCSTIFLFFIFSYCLISQNETKILLIETLATVSSEKAVLKLLPLVKKDFQLKKEIPMGKPIKQNYKISSNFGKRFHPIDKVTKFHSGIDLVSEYASTIHATADGVIIFAGKKGGYGKCVIIEHKYGFKTVYAHLDIYYAKQGRTVEKGDVIGFLGSTGKSSGNHLHYEIEKNGKKINPLHFLK